MQNIGTPMLHFINKYIIFYCIILYFTFGKKLSFFMNLTYYGEQNKNS